MSKKKVKKPIGPETIKSYSLDEIEDKHIGEKGTVKRDAYEAKLKAELTPVEDLKKETLGEVGTPKRDAYEKELGEDVALQNVQNNFENLEWKWDDTKTESKPAKTKTPASDKGHGKELDLALSHLKPGEVFLLSPSQVLTEPAMDIMTKSSDRLILSYPGKDNDFLIAEMAKRYFVLNVQDTEYVRTAVRLSKEAHLYKTLLVFDKR